MARPKKIEPAVWAAQAPPFDPELIYTIPDQAATEAAIVDVADMPTLADYIKARERDGIVLTRVTYPQATPHVYAGMYSGIVVADGPLSCTWSDGSKQDS